MTELEDRLSRALHEDVPVPPHALDPASIRAASIRRVRHPRRTAVVMLGAAAAVLVVVGVPVGIHLSGHRAAVPAPTTSAAPSSAAAYSASLLRQVPLPSSARRVPAAPSTALPGRLQGDSRTADSLLVWWTVPVAAVDLTSALGNTRLPAHWTTGETFSDSADPPTNGKVFEIRDPDSAFVASVTVTIVRSGQGSGVSAEVDTYRLPVRTASQIIPTDASATVTAVRGYGSNPTTRRITLTDSAARTLVRRVNGTRPDVSLVTASCPYAPGGLTVEFASGPRRWKLVVPNGSSLCNAPALTGPDGGDLQLADLESLKGDVLDAAGLPRTYFG